MKERNHERANDGNPGTTSGPGKTLRKIVVLAFHPKVSTFVRKAVERALGTFPNPFRKILDQPGRKFWFLPIE